VSFEKIAQQKIQEAIEAGEFDNLPNSGQKLDLESYFALPAHLRMAYSVLKSANCVPHEIDLLNEVTRLEAEVARAGHAEPQVRMRRDLEDARLRLNVALDRLRADARRRSA